jgi:hypothetical protein
MKSARNRVPREHQGLKALLELRAQSRKERNYIQPVKVLKPELVEINLKKTQRLNQVVFSLNLLQLA